MTRDVSLVLGSQAERPLAQESECRADQDDAVRQRALDPQGLLNPGRVL